VGADAGLLAGPHLSPAVGAAGLEALGFLKVKLERDAAVADGEAPGSEPHLGAPGEQSGAFAQA
jgi:hypothetical protein